MEKLTASGIGPKDHLAEVGKTCIVDLPGVGSSLVYPLSHDTTDSRAAGPPLRDHVVPRSTTRFHTPIPLEPVPYGDFHP